MDGELVLDDAFGLWTDSARFRVVGAAPGARVTFDVRGATASGVVRSRAVIIAGEDGIADPCVDPSVEGSYLGIDGRGLWWSLEPESGHDYLAFEYEVRASVEGVELGVVEVSRSALPPGAVYGELPEPMVGYWFAPRGREAAPPVLVLG